MAGRRKRAWLFLRAAAPGPAVEELGGFLAAGADQHVVVRADRVTETPDFPFNIVVPIDAKSDGELKKITAELVRVSGATAHTYVSVVDHVPDPPHNAQGYITEDEARAGKEKDVPPGRQGASPGRNPWG